MHAHKESQIELMLHTCMWFYLYQQYTDVDTLILHTLTCPHPHSNAMSILMFFFLISNFFMNSMSYTTFIPTNHVFYLNITIHQKQSNLLHHTHSDYLFIPKLQDLSIERFTHCCLVHHTWSIH